MCINLVYTMWLEWINSPVIISFDHRPLDISDIPFPATTICPITKSKTSIFNYTHVYRLMTKLDGEDTRSPNQTEYGRSYQTKFQ